MIECQPSESDDVMTRLRWWAFKFCGKGERENLASDTMSDAIAHIEKLETLVKELLRSNWDNSWPTMRKYDTFEEYQNAVLGGKND